MPVDSYHEMAPGSRAARIRARYASLTAVGLTEKEARAIVVRETGCSHAAAAEAIKRIGGPGRTGRPRTRARCPHCDRPMPAVRPASDS
jgi:hypothetical protein